MSEPVVPLTPEEESFWRAFARAMLVVPRGLDSDLRSTAQLQSSEYGILMTLSESPSRQLRISELADRVAMSVSRVSRMVGQLDSEGYVTRTRSDLDGRGQVACLTDEGLRRLEGAWPPHLRSVRSRVVEHVDPAQLATLTDILNRMVARSEREQDTKPGP
jgi:DNA-binding MarR family transcriptional regulator